MTTITLPIEAAQTVLRALEINRVMGADEQGEYTKEITPKSILTAIALMQEAFMPRPHPISWNLKYVDSTPKLNVGNSAFEDWYQQQPFATQEGIKQLCRDSYAAGMGDPLVTYSILQVEQQGWVSLKDGLPQPHQIVLVARGKFVTAGSYSPAFGWEWEVLDGEDSDSEATHWMALPTAPR